MTRAGAVGRPRARALAAGLLAALLLPALGAGPPSGRADPAIRTSAGPIQVRAAVRPAIAELGERVTYHGWVLARRPGWARWLPPDTSAIFTWGAPTVLQRDWLRRRKLDPGARHGLGDTLFVDVPLQAFALGRLAVPGLGVEIDDGRGPRAYRLPAVTLTVLPMLTDADANVDFRALHGPLAAPWWERVPWTWVALGLLAAAAAVALVAWRRRRRRDTIPSAAASPVDRDPLAVAMAALAALRKLNLPEHGRFAEHAFRLGQILRRYLEAVTGATRPGHTTPELVAHLQRAGVEPEDLTRLSGLLRVWDRVKFAREPLTLAEAVRAERTTEAFLRRPPGPAEKVA